MTISIRLGVALAACMIAAPVLARSDPHGEPVGDTLSIGTRTGSPYDHLPSGTRLISSFGERPVFSPDGTKVAFIGKSYGDAFEYDIATHTIRNLTAHMPHQGILRVHYLSDGSFLLLAPHVPDTTLEKTRFGRIELWWMDAAATQPAVRLGAHVFEGIAVSRTSNLISWAETTPSDATDMRAATGSILKTARVVTTRIGAHLDDIRQVASKPASDCLMEPQDFLPGERALTLPCYRFGGKSAGPITDVLSVDLATGAFTRYPTPPQFYGEVEGIFPDGKRTLVECSGDRSAGMDLCLLDLKPVSPRYTRLTRIMDYGRYKYGNPVVRRDGRMIAAQVGSADVVDVGMGQGIVLIDLPADF